MRPNLKQLIKQGREKAGLTRAKLANHLGVSPAAVTYWEQGVKVPSGDITIELIKHLDLVKTVFPEAFPQSSSPLPRNIEDRVADLEKILLNKS